MEEDFLDILKDKTIFYDCEIYFDDAAKEIASLQIEFIEWLLSGNDGTFIQSHRDDDKILFFVDVDEPYVTLTEVYKYWKTNINNK